MPLSKRALPLDVEFHGHDEVDVPLLFSTLHRDNALGVLEIDFDAIIIDFLETVEKIDVVQRDVEVFALVLNGYFFHGSTQSRVL